MTTITAHFENFQRPLLGSNQILDRGVHLLSVPCYAITAALDAIVGLGAAALTLLTVGEYRPFIEVATDYWGTGGAILANPYRSLVKVLNPNTHFTKLDDIELITNSAVRPLINLAQKFFAESENGFVKHVVSRATYLLAALVTVVCQVVDGAIGMLAAVFSLLTGGAFESLNHWAYKGLAFPTVVGQVFLFTVFAMNPSLHG